MSRVLDIVEPFITEIVEANHSELVDLEYVKEGPSWYLRVYADQEGGIDLDQCALLSEKISEALDQIKPDPFPKSYYLEVSSPGAERPLKTEEAIASQVGSYVHFDYYVPQEGEKFHEGTLLAVEDEVYQLEIRDKSRTKQISIDKKSVAKARLAVKF